MSRIRSKGTTPERLIFSELRKLGIRYSKHIKVFGTPDIAFKAEKLAVFIDGDFWHGYNWKVLGQKPKSDFWRKKISRNIKRDTAVDKQLHSIGWKTMRIWEHEVLKDPAPSAKRIMHRLNRLRPLVRVELP